MGACRGLRADVSALSASGLGRRGSLPGTARGGNLRYLQAVDFLLGWTGIDICFDDGKERGEWFGKSVYGWGSPEAESEPVAAKAKPKPVAAKPKVVPKDEDKGYHVIRGDRVLGRILRDKLDGSE